jgi:hypothetical protein
MADQHVAHGSAPAAGGQNLHAGHLVAMFRDKLWLSLALTISHRILVERHSILAGVHSSDLPRLKIHPAHPRDGRFCLRRPRFHPRSLGRTCRPSAGHDDSRQPGDHSRFWEHQVLLERRRQFVPLHHNQE